MIICYAQGLAMLYKASTELDMDIPLPEVVRIWRGGCIIRSSLLEFFMQRIRQIPALPNILLDKCCSQTGSGKKTDICAILSCMPPKPDYPCWVDDFTGYLDAYRSEFLPTNLIQAQRDYFGAHTYQRIDMPGSFHTEWESF